MVLGSPQKIMKVNAGKIKSIYGRSKLLSTNYLLKIYKEKISCSNFKTLFNLWTRSKFRQTPITILNCIKNNSFDCSSGKQIRNFMYVKDFIKILYKFLL